MAVICAIAGGSGAGKTTLANLLLDELGDAGAHTTIDWYYHDQSHLDPVARDAVNFDHPASLDVDAYAADLRVLRGGRAIEAPVYDFATHSRTGATRSVPAADIIVTEGIHLLSLEPVRDVCDLLVFIDVSAAVRLERRKSRDVAERGRTPESVEAQWHATVAPMHEQFVQPSAAYAHRVVRECDDLAVAATELAHELRERLVAATR